MNQKALLNYVINKNSGRIEEAIKEILSSKDVVSIFSVMARKVVAVELESDPMITEDTDLDNYIYTLLKSPKFYSVVFNHIKYDKKEEQQSPVEKKVEKVIEGLYYVVQANPNKNIAVSEGELNSIADASSVFEMNDIVKLLKKKEVIRSSVHDGEFMLDREAIETQFSELNKTGDNKNGTVE